jgi:hypothetical protein
MQDINSLRGQKAICQNVTADCNIRGDTQMSLKLECRAKTACSTVALSKKLENVSVSVIVYG